MKKSKFKISFQLKQHTPMIHFQYNQNGATLRATELKPKLDKFLINEFKLLDDNNKEANKELFIDINKKALNYKTRIIYKGINKIDTPKPYIKKGESGYWAPYFADGKSIEHNQEVEIVFYSKNNQLLNMIDESLSMFLAKENFGTRQSKGFGCYYIKDYKEKDFINDLKKLKTPIYKLKSSAKDGKDALKKIDYFYRRLKAGTNQPQYHKSLLFRYMCNNKDGYGWEKRRIKEVFKEVVYGEHSPVDCEPQKEYRYIRALLGLAEHNEYDPYNDKNKKLQIKIESNEENKIERFRSPITFKVFNKSIYLIANEPNPIIFNHNFKFSLGNNCFTIFTPDKFSMEHFLDWVVENENFITKVE